MDPIVIVGAAVSLVSSIVAEVLKQQAISGEQKAALTALLIESAERLRAHAAAFGPAQSARDADADAALAAKFPPPPAPTIVVG